MRNRFYEPDNLRSLFYRLHPVQIADQSHIAQWRNQFMLYVSKWRTTAPTMEIYTDDAVQRLNNIFVMKYPLPQSYRQASNARDVVYEELDDERLLFNSGGIGKAFESVRRPVNPIDDGTGVSPDRFYANARSLGRTDMNWTNKIGASSATQTTRNGMRTVDIPLNHDLNTPEFTDQLTGYNARYLYKRNPQCTPDLITKKLYDRSNEEIVLGSRSIGDRCRE